VAEEATGSGAFGRNPSPGKIVVNGAAGVRAEVKGHRNGTEVVRPGGRAGHLRFRAGSASGLQAKDCELVGATS